MIPIQFTNNPSSTYWIKLQEQGAKSDRQMVFAQTDTSPKLKSPRPKYLETIANQTMIWESSGCLSMEKSVGTIVKEILQGQSVFPIPRM